MHRRRKKQEQPSPRFIPGGSYVDDVQVLQDAATPNVASDGLHEMDLFNEGHDTMTNRKG